MRGSDDLNIPEDRSDSSCTKSLDSEGSRNRSSLTSMPEILLMEEMEALSVKLKQKEQELREMEAGILNEAEKWPQGERAHLYFQLQAADDRYCRLLEAHRRLTRVNQSLEDKLLRLADKFESEKNALVAALSHTTQQLAESQVTLQNTREELERYKTDCSLAAHLLQCRSSHFLSQRLETLPSQFQEKVRGMVDRRIPNGKPNKTQRCTGKVIKVPIPTFPPTAMVFTVPASDKSDDGDKKSKDKPVDYVSAAILGKVMEERAKEREEMWQKKQQQNQKYHCQSCLCFKPNLDKSLALLNSETCDQAVETEADMRERSPSNSGDGDNYSLHSNEIDSVFIDMASSGSTDGWKDNWTHSQFEEDGPASNNAERAHCDDQNSMLISVHRPAHSTGPRKLKSLESPRSFHSETPV